MNVTLGDCCTPRLDYLLKNGKTLKRQLLTTVSHACGAPLQDLNLPGKLAHVYVRDMSCGDPIEKLYYTVRLMLS